MFELLKHIFGGNEFASGGLLLMLLGGLGVYLRAVPRILWEWCVRQTTLTITVRNDDAAFVWVKEWLLEQSFLRQIRQVDLDTTLRGQALSLIPAPGRHWFWHSGRPVVVQFERSERTAGYARKPIESLTFTTLGRGQDFLQQFVSEIVQCHEKSLRLKSSLFVYDDCWSQVLGYNPRWVESVILKPGEKEHLLQDIETFRASRKRYSELGVPYHRGYLLFGPPGTGKTCLASAIAQRFGMSVYAINLGSFNDRTLVSAVGDVPPNSVILFEDIDCMAGSKARARSGHVSPSVLQPGNAKNQTADQLGVTLAGLLNVLDGFGAPENVLFIMTTNRVEDLDEALLRPGRIDYRLYMGEATDGQKAELYRRFFPSASIAEVLDFVAAHGSVRTMAEFQGLLLGLQCGTAHDLDLQERSPVLK